MECLEALCHESYKIDLTDTANVCQILRKVEPDLVIHCAGLIELETCEKQPDLARKINVDVTESLVKNCGVETKFAYISTDQVYGNCPMRSEDALELQPVNEYGKTKLLAEKKVLSLRPDSLVTRTNIFGVSVKSGRTSSAEWILSSLIDGKPITLFYDYVFSPIYTRGFGRILENLVLRNLKGVFNVGAPLGCSKLEFGHVMASIGGYEKENIGSGSVLEFLSSCKRPTNLSLNTRKTQETGIRLPHFRESILEFLSDTVL